MNVTRILSIVVASPNDVKAERDCVPGIVDELNRGIAKSSGIVLQARMWEKDAFPGFHPFGPQGLIDEILKIPESDILIVIFWKRFGTLLSDGDTGSQHEWRRGYENWQKHGRPHILMYFNQKSYSPRTKAETDQWGAVLEFQHNLPKEGLWWPYRSKSQFRDLVRQHLTSLVLQHVSPATAASAESAGRVKEVIGPFVRATVPQAFVGELCLIHNPRSSAPVKAEVVGFQHGDVLLVPLGELVNIGTESEVVRTGNCLTVPVGDGLLGRVLSGLGEAIDTELRGPVTCTESCPLYGGSEPLRRKDIVRQLSTGVRAIDALIPCGEGQRFAVLAPPMTGRMVFLSMIARNAEVDMNVIILVGERRREIRDFVEHDLGMEGLSRSVVICAASDEPAPVRLKAAYVGTAIAEHFRRRGKRVMLIIDSVTRFAQAQREFAIARGEQPGRDGYPPSVFAELPKLLERAGNSEHGSITAFYTVLAEANDVMDAVCNEVRSSLDGHIVLSRDLAARCHFPAIALRDSRSLMTREIAWDHHHAAGRAREVLAIWEKHSDAILLGHYREGDDPRLDDAISKLDAVQSLLKQSLDEKPSAQETIQRLLSIFT